MVGRRLEPRGRNVLPASCRQSLAVICALAACRVALLFALYAVLAFSLQPSAFASYTLTFVPPLPADTNGALIGYQAAWQYTNTTSTNTWYFFAQVPTSSTRIVINGTVGSPAWIIVRSVGTNGLLSTNLTLTLYNTNTLAATMTNNPPVIPTGPTTFAITNN